MTDHEQPDTATSSRDGRKGNLLLLGAIGFLLIPVVIGWAMANRDSGSDADTSESGMDVVATSTELPGVAPSTEATTSRTNLSLVATVVETSSEFNADFAGAKAIDGSLSTEWSSMGDGDDAYIVIDLGTAREITGIGFRTREMSDGTSITNSYTVSVDGGDSIGPFDAGIGLFVSDLAADGQIVRIDMDTTTGGNTGAVEIEIYGS